MNHKFLLLISFTILIACAHDHADGDHEHDHDHATAEAHDDHHDHDDHDMEEAHEDEVGLTTIQMEKIGLALGSFEQKNLKSTLKVNGQLELPPQNKADVSAIAAGKISSIRVRSGQYVKKGTPLAYLQNTDFIEWQQSFLEVEAELVYLNKEWKRQEELVTKQIAPQKQLDKITSERAIAQAKLKGIQSRLKLLGIPNPTGELVNSIAVRSPLNGYVREIKANTGGFVNPDQSLFEIVDNHHLHIDLKVFEKDLAYIKNGQKIQFSLQSQPNEVMDAYIFAIGRALDEEERTVAVHAEIKEEKSNLLPGMFVEARIILDDKALTNTLPEEAITVDKGLYYIFIKEEEHEDETHFRKIPVLKGVSDLGYVEVNPLEALPPNAEIVVKSAYFLMAQSKKGEERAGHHH